MKVTTGSAFSLFFFCRQHEEAFTDGLATSEDVDFHLFFGNVHDGGDILVRLTLNITQFHGGALLLWQLRYQLVYHADAVVADGYLFRIGGIAKVFWICSRWHIRPHGVVVVTLPIN